MRAIHSIRSVMLAAMALVLVTVPSLVSAQEEADVQSLERRLQRLENIVNSGQLAEIVQQLDTLSGEIRELRGEIETQGHRLDELRDRQRNLYADLDRRLRELEVAGRVMEPEEATDGETTDAGNDEAADVAVEAALEAGTGTGGGDGGGDGGSDEQERERDPEAERKAYDAAFQLLREGRYEESAEAFRTFLEDFPDGPYADNARYWLGESRYVTRKFTPALEAFREVVENHPGSAKVPDARLKMGYTLYEMARYEEAREVLQTVVDQHPDSAVARLAEERLVKMKNEGH